MSWFRSRSRRPRTLPSIRRSPTRTTRPPSRLGSTSTSSAMRPPVDCSSRAVRARTSSGVSGAALVAVAWVMPWRRSSRRRNSAATRGSSSIRPRRSSSRIEVRDACAGDAVPEQLGRRRSAASLERDGRVGEDVEGPLVAQRGCCHIELGAPTTRACRHAWPPRRRPRRNGARRCFGEPSVRSRSPSCVGGASRNSSTSRRCRSSVIVSPTTRPAAAQRQVGDLGAQLADGALLLGLDLGGRALAHPLELLTGRGDVGVAASPGRPSGRGPGCRSPRGAPRPASATRSASALSRSRRACSASFRPCSIRSPCVVQHPSRRA